MIGFFRRLIQRYGFFRREHAGLPFDDQGSIFWYNDSFYTEEKRRNERLAQIARERDALKEQLAKAIRDKKARSPYYKVLRALTNEELALDGGK